jgi:sulfite reductase (NADPH) flavoprotein alpha-component
MFCTAGEQVDAQLDKLGGKRIVPLQKCDLDYNEEAGAWIDEVFKSLSDQSQSTEVKAPVLNKSTGKKIFTGDILSHINLNDRGSNKATFHIEISAEDINYKPGDSIGIIPPNPFSTVEKILYLCSIDHNTNIEYKGGLISVVELLSKKLSIIQLPERVVKHYASIVKQDIPVSKIDLFDLLKIYPVANEDQFLDVVKILEPTTPRLYSISSSPEAHRGEIHITVARNTFMINEELKNGLASDFLCNLSLEDQVTFYINPNNQFRLPEEDKSIIMIGPGTGIAPFRSFIAKRDAVGATGKNWLFFGEQHFTSDFLYQTEIQGWFETGVLTRVNTAFSRDQAQKIYVQDKMWQHGAEFFEWLQAGSYVYICGSKYPMSIDVEATILKIVQHFGERTKEEAQEYLDDLKEEGRYVLDVY